MNLNKLLIPVSWNVSLRVYLAILEEFNIPIYICVCAVTSTGGDTFCRHVFFFLLLHSIKDLFMGVPYMCVCILHGAGCFLFLAAQCHIPLSLSVRRKIATLFIK